uniref:Disease resistance R13L4/SHOC-2-like LRR domain-containing protein n=1 Tax=Fagus sylvatica TaxID=28930 RepID=A0A2N9GFP6_FAGSY
MECVRKLYLDGTAITKLPASIENLNGLASLKLKDCKNLVCLPSTIFNLKLLKDVDISGCSKVERLPENLGNAESVEELDVSGTALRHVPSFIGHLKNLRKLSFEGCKGLSSSNKSWYELIPFYSKPISPNPVGLSHLLGLCSLTELNLRDCNLKAIPNDIGTIRSSIQMSILQLLSLEVKFRSGLAIKVWGLNFIVNGKEIHRGGCSMDTIESDHIFLACCSTRALGDRFSKSLVENDANGFCQIGIRFQIDFQNKGVKKCGVRLLYKKDIEDHIPTDSDSDSTLVTEGNKVKRRRDEYDGAGPSGEGSSNDVPHPNRIERPIEFDNSDSEESSDVMCCNTCLYKKDIEDPIPTTAQCNKVKRSRDEYDGVGPSGEGSSNDVPHPKRIERPTEFDNSNSEESSKYKDCDEELSDVQ